jgi:parvulin-like peptidyl-prolyl isomerase
MALMPDSLQEVGKVIPLPQGDQLQQLFGCELLMPFLQRCVLEALADQGAAGSVPTEQHLNRLAHHVGLEGLDDLDRWCEHHSVSLSTLHTLASFPERLQAATEAIWGDDVPSRFLERRSQLDQAVLSLLRFDDADLAQELYFQMLDGETVFPQLIDRYGNRPGQPARGLVGPVSLESLHPLLARVAERYEPGALIPPLDINGSVHLIRVEQLQKATLNDAMRQRLLLELRQQWMDEQLSLLLGRLASEALNHPA